VKDWAFSPTGKAIFWGKISDLCAKALGIRVTSSQTTVMTAIIIVSVKPITSPFKILSEGGRPSGVGA
jgi:hypothetical protein